MALACFSEKYRGVSQYKGLGRCFTPTSDAAERLLGYINGVSSGLATRKLFDAPAIARGGDSYPSCDSGSYLKTANTSRIVLGGALGQFHEVRSLEQAKAPGVSRGKASRHFCCAAAPRFERLLGEPSESKPRGSSASQRSGRARACSCHRKRAG